MTYVEEALKWLPPPDQARSITVVGTQGAARILLADDNADMREYLARLLFEQRMGGRNGRRWSTPPSPAAKAPTARSLS